MSRPVSGRTLTPHPSPGLREPAVVETSTLQQTKQPPAWVCVWENERESVCVKRFHKAINRHVYTRGSVSAALPWRQSSRQQLCHIHQSFEEFTQRDAVLFSWCRNISRPDEGIVVVFLFSINRKVNEETKGRTRIVFYWSRCLICVWTLRLWCAILGTGRSRSDSNTFINNS